jgi:hypothetical protein
MFEAIARVQACELHLLAIVAAVGQPYDGRSVLVDPRWQALEEALGDVGSWLPPRVPGSTPFPDEQPNTLRTADGRWLSANAEPRAGWHPQQPERVARP